MAESAESSAPTPEAPSSLPSAPILQELRVPMDQLPRVTEALAQSFGEAGVGGPELSGLFASGVKVSCVACGLGVTGAELNELSLGEAETRDRPLPPKLERLRLGFCPRSGCESRFAQIQVTAPGRFDRGWILGRTQQILTGKAQGFRAPSLKVSAETRRLTQRLAWITLGTLFLAFVAYRLIFFRSQPIPFVQPKSPYSLEPTSIDPNQR